MRSSLTPSPSTTATRTVYSSSPASSRSSSSVMCRSCSCYRPAPTRTVRGRPCRQSASGRRRADQRCEPLQRSDQRRRASAFGGLDGSAKLQRIASTTTSSFAAMMSSTSARMTGSAAVSCARHAMPSVSHALIGAASACACAEAMRTSQPNFGRYATDRRPRLRGPTAWMASAATSKHTMPV